MADAAAAARDGGGGGGGGEEGGVVCGEEPGVSVAAEKGRPYTEAMELSWPSDGARVFEWCG
jgi:hypothetical protein